jgi:integrase
MTHCRDQVMRIAPGIYRRGDRYVVRYRDPTGRQRKRAAGSLREAQVIRAAAQISGRQRPKHAQVLALLMMESGARPNELTALRSSDLRPRHAPSETPAPHDPGRPWPGSDWKRTRSSDGSAPEA